MALAANEHLEDLNIGGNDLRDNGIQYLEYALRVNKCLKKLDLSNCHLTSQSAESLGRVLLANQCLEELNLSHNEKFGDDGIQHLAQILRANQCLKILDVSHCGMTDIGLKQLAISLTHNCSLAELTLETFSGDQDNKLTVGIVPVLSHCLKQNSTLTKLLLPLNLASSTTSTEEAVNAVRRAKGLPLISICTQRDELLKRLKE